MSFVSQCPTAMAVDEFLEWSSGGEHSHQLIDGLPRRLPADNRGVGLTRRRIRASLLDLLRFDASGLLMLEDPGIVPPVMPERNLRVPSFAVARSLESHVVQEQAGKIFTLIADSQGALRFSETKQVPVAVFEIDAGLNKSDTISNLWVYFTIPSLQDIVLFDGSGNFVEHFERPSGGGWTSDADANRTGRVRLGSFGKTFDLTPPTEAFTPS